MVFCRTCDCEVDIDFDESGGVACCTQCGRVVEDGAFASDIQFAKGPDGEGGMVGQFVAEDGRARGVGHYSGGRMWGSGGVSDARQAQPHLPCATHLPHSC